MATKVLTLDEIIHQLLQLQAQGKGNYKMVWGASHYCDGYPVINVTVNDNNKEIHV